LYTSYPVYAYIYISINHKDKMKNQEVKIEASHDGEKKWDVKGVFLNAEKAYLSLAFEQAKKNYPYVRVVPNTKVGRMNYKVSGALLKSTKHS